MTLPGRELTPFARHFVLKPDINVGVMLLLPELLPEGAWLVVVTASADAKAKKDAMILLEISIVSLILGVF
jgi:hypothetical protein